ncbi:hypothetical protein [Alishewanella longhuensis]
MWELVSFVAAMVVFMCLIELFDVPDWIRANLKNGITRANLEAKVEALELQIQELEHKVQRLSE